MIGYFAIQKNCASTVSRSDHVRSQTEVSCQPRVVHQMYPNVAVGSPQKISDHHVVELAMDQYLWKVTIFNGKIDYFYGHFHQQTFEVITRGYKVLTHPQLFRYSSVVPLLLKQSQLAMEKCNRPLRDNDL